MVSCQSSQNTVAELADMEPGDLRTTKVMEEVALVDVSWMVSSVPMQRGMEKQKQEKKPHS